MYKHSSDSSQGWLVAAVIDILRSETPHQIGMDGIQYLPPGYVFDTVHLSVCQQDISKVMIGY